MQFLAPTRSGFQHSILPNRPLPEIKKAFACILQWTIWSKIAALAFSPRLTGRLHLLSKDISPETPTYHTHRRDKAPTWASEGAVHPISGIRHTLTARASVVIRNKTVGRAIRDLCQSNPVTRMVGPKERKIDGRFCVSCSNRTPTISLKKGRGNGSLQRYGGT